MRAARRDSGFSALEEQFFAAGDALGRAGESQTHELFE
jgi:hypothetical protein